MQKRSFSASIYGFVLTGLLTIAIFVSMVGAFRSTAQQSDTENRRFSALPAFPDSLAACSTFPQRFEAFFNDHFGLRAALIKTDTAIATRLLDRLPTQDVIAGQADWLFFAAGSALSLYQRTSPLSSHALEGWLSGLSSRAQWLAEQGIGYAFTIAPDKHTIHHEFMPRYLRAGSAPSQYDQIIDLAQVHKLPVIDLRPVLLSAKDQGPLYFRDDTHWNPWGAYIAYRNLIEHIGKSVTAKRVSLLASDFEMRPNGPGDLARMAQKSRIEMAPALGASAQLCASLTIDRKANEAGTLVMVRTRCEGQNGKLLLFRDSFSDALLPYFAASFGEVVAIWGEPTNDEIKKLVAQEQPDFVLEERVERHLKRAPNAHLPAK